MHLFNHIVIAVPLLSSLTSSQDINCDDVDFPTTHSVAAVTSETQPFQTPWPDCEEPVAVLSVQAVVPSLTILSTGRPTRTPCPSAGCFSSFGNFSLPILWPNATSSLANGTAQPSVSISFPQPSSFGSLAGIVSGGVCSACLDYRLFSTSMFLVFVIGGSRILV